jgi:hypothetical protein
MKELKPIKCAVCGKKFTPKNASATVCSKECRIKRDSAKRKEKNLAKKAGEVKAEEKIKLPEQPTENIEEVAHYSMLDEKTRFVGVAMIILINAIKDALASIIDEKSSKRKCKCKGKCKKGK